MILLTAILLILFHDITSLSLLCYKVKSFCDITKLNKWYQTIDLIISYFVKLQSLRFGKQFKGKYFMISHRQFYKIAKCLRIIKMSITSNAHFCCHNYQFCNSTSKFSAISKSFCEIKFSFLFDNITKLILRYQISTFWDHKDGIVITQNVLLWFTETNLTIRVLLFFFFVISLNHSKTRSIQSL